MGRVKWECVYCGSHREELEHWLYFNAISDDLKTKRQVQLIIDEYHNSRQRDGDTDKNTKLINLMGAHCWEFVQETDSGFWFKRPIEESNDGLECEFDGDF